MCSMGSHFMTPPPVALRTFIRRQWWALLAGFVSAVVIGSFAAGLYVLVLFFSGGWFYGVMAISLLLARRFLRRREGQLAASRRDRMVTVAAMTATAVVSGVVLHFAWHCLGAWWRGQARSSINAEDIAWVGGPILVLAIVHLLSAWIVEWAGRHTDARRLGIPS